MKPMNLVGVGGRYDKCRHIIVVEQKGSVRGSRVQQVRCMSRTQRLGMKVKVVIELDSVFLEMKCGLCRPRKVGC